MNAVSTAELDERGAGVVFSEDRDDLRLGEAGLPHAGFLSAHRPGKPTVSTDPDHRGNVTTNTKPGIVYMYAGGTDWSADDPYASKGTPITEPAHWMIMWPFDLKASGIPSKVANTGTWVMWAGTPYAHLMINGKAKS
ncbi:hypothetical protein WPS_15330 [Vulcanimicrobium alpinum]|uniref:Uncharacterized protein n=1 Tax=Vulcanimicrobium alpinum TaxID=3016050 RepID=A0AAN1XVN0_UNVUL|nr:hypothetical protein [Vulcanimicrobium alpinum]BDE06257.1 hypothetical protein WPS_15330 [Vulcanimicrobium alpinum]